MRRSNRDTGNRRNRDNTVPYVVFGIAGALLVSVSIIFDFREWETAQQVCLNIGITIVAVVIVELMWRRFGGDPITRAISSLWRATNLLKDFEAAGINSIKAQRRQLDSQEHTDLLCKLLDNATHVDLMAWSLRTQIAKHKDIMSAIEDAIRSNRCQVRVLTSCPFHEISECDPQLLQRIREEERLTGGESAVDRIRGNITDTWVQFNEIRGKFKNDRARKDCLQIKATNEMMIYTNIIRIDDRMWVSPYSASVRGGENPVFEVVGTHSALFNRFQTEFDHMWNPPPPRQEEQKRLASESVATRNTSHRVG